MPPISPPPATSPGTDELPAYLSSGVVGLRVLDIPMLPGIAIVSGFAQRHPTLQIEANAPAPYPLAGDISVDGVWLTSSPHQARFVEQRYDFATGELTTRFEFSTTGATARVEVLTFCSQLEPTIVAQEVTIEVDRAASVVVRALVDPSHIVGRMRRKGGAIGDGAKSVDGSMLWQSLGDLARCGIAYATELRGDEGSERQVLDWGDEGPLATEYSIRARADRRYRLRQIAALVPDVLHHDPDHQAVRIVGRVAANGFDALRAANRDEWAEHWKSRIVVDADDDRWQAIADAALFYLHTSVHPSAPSSTSIYGLALWNDYHYYYGHVMWDIESFAIPVLTLVQPDAARSMLGFRTQTLQGARSNARLHGRRGLQFPWESGPLHGEETAPAVGHGSWYSDHVSLDVAHAFSQFAHATGDEHFLELEAWPVLCGVTDWLTSRLTPVGRARLLGFRQSMGPAERQQPVDNPAYSLMLARLVFDEAIATAERLGKQVPQRWRDSRSRLAPPPTSRSTGAIVSHEAFRSNEEKGATPDPLAGLFPAWYPTTPDVEQATLRAYLDLADGYLGSPMLAAFYPVWAAWAGDREASARFLESGYGEYIGDRFRQTLEVSPRAPDPKPRSGPFFANLSAFLLGLICGFPGLKVGPGEPETWPSRRVVLPAGWRSIEVERLWVREQPTRLVARHGMRRAELIRSPSARRQGAAA